MNYFIVEQVRGRRKKEEGGKKKGKKKVGCCERTKVAW